jgi:hypothetical protein
MNHWRASLRSLHRDLGYFFTGFVLLYCISGLAVNHADHWDPSYAIERREVALRLPAPPDTVDAGHVRATLAGLADVGRYRSHDQPSPHKLKVYLDDGTMLVDRDSGQGVYEAVRRRPLLFEANALHLHPEGWWLGLSDFFAIGLLFLALSGLLLLKGRRGFAGRGKWLVAAGFALPLAAMLTVG